MAKRTYQEYCPLAAATNILGQRWAVLIIRNLLTGPQRYSDLLSGLPGISTDILARRLRELEKSGIVERRQLPPPAASTVYALTAFGQGLKAPLAALSIWGANLLGPPKAEDHLAPASILLALSGLITDEEVDGPRLVAEFAIDGSWVHIDVGEGKLNTGTGRAEHPQASIETDTRTFVALGAGYLTVEEALAAPSTRSSGSPEALARALALVRFPSEAHGLPGAYSSAGSSRPARPG